MDWSFPAHPWVIPVKKVILYTSMSFWRLPRGYGRMAVEFLDPLGRGGKPSNIPYGIFWSNLVVLR
jgi:hypothetical protein